MIQNVMHSIGGVSMYGVISICLFFAVFIGVLVWIICLKKPYLNEMRELPLEGESVSESEREATLNPEGRHE